ncbi:uncharacterized protein LOC131248451 [Magnolia sinica]|uniref:uncharacterized protein LOC131248451 n=1 Tax=Magnolia sinica TaxID=86752 RepID=UPI00265AE129|nr:uncharacterized protein LOC131248451 [Magnolia sinica]
MVGPTEHRPPAPCSQSVSPKTRPLFSLPLIHSPSVPLPAPALEISPTSLFLSISSRTSDMKTSLGVKKQKSSTKLKSFDGSEELSIAEKQEDDKGTLSTHEKELQKIRSKIEQMEKENLETKAWTMQGEVTASKRPKNSALEVDLDFEHNVRPPPVITEEVTASLEELITKRIIEGHFGDVQRAPSLPSKAPKELKRAEIVSEERVMFQCILCNSLIVTGSKFSVSEVGSFFTQKLSQWKAIFKPPKAMRGGIPICFPQFGNSGSLEQHGFARNKIWTIDDDPPPLHPAEYIGKSSLDLLLKPSEEDLKCWPHCFEFRLRVALALNGDLTMISRIRNLDSKPFSFSFAFHTFFSISVIRNFNGSCCWNLCCSGCHYTISSFVYTLVRLEERN